MNAMISGEVILKKCWTLVLNPFHEKMNYEWKDFSKKGHRRGSGVRVNLHKYTKGNVSEISGLKTGAVLGQEFICMNIPRERVQRKSHPKTGWSLIRSFIVQSMF